MPVFSALTHDGLRAAFEKAGYAVLDEDKYNWKVGQGEGVPFIIPRRGRLVAAEVVEGLYRSYWATPALQHEIELQMEIEVTTSIAATQAAAAARPTSDPPAKV